MTIAGGAGAAITANAAGLATAKAMPARRVNAGKTTIAAVRAAVGETKTITIVAAEVADAAMAAGSETAKATPRPRAVAGKIAAKLLVPN